MRWYMHTALMEARHSSSKERTKSRTSSEIRRRFEPIPHGITCTHKVHETAEKEVKIFEKGALCLFMGMGHG